MVAPYYIACAGVLLIIIFFSRSCAQSVFGGPSVVANAVPGPVFTGPEPKKMTTADARALVEDFAKIDAQEHKDEAKVNFRIPLRRRKQVYYAACKSRFDALQSGSPVETKDMVAEVCHKYHISYDTEETIRQEGLDNGWPEPELPVAP